VPEFIDRIIRSLRSFDQINITTEDMLGSIDRSHQRGITKSEYNILGVAFGAIRLDHKLTVDELSLKSGVPREDIIDLELASFHLHEAVEIAFKLKGALEINQENYNRILSSTTIKK